MTDKLYAVWVYTSEDDIAINFSTYNTIEKPSGVLYEDEVWVENYLFVNKYNSTKHLQQSYMNHWINATDNIEAFYTTNLVLACEAYSGRIAYKLDKLKTERDNIEKKIDKLSHISTKE